MNNNNSSSNQEQTTTIQEQEGTTYDLFVGGLPSSCTADLLNAYFSQFGEILESLPQTWNKKSTKCRGFAIVKCSNEATFGRIMGFNKHVLLERVIECKPYFKNREQLKLHNSDLQERKIFVRGLSSKVSKKDLEGYFSQFGQLEICYVVKHKKSGKSKGFGYMCFLKKEDSEAVLKIGRFTIKGKPIDCFRYTKSKGGKPTGKPADNEVGGVGGPIAENHVLTAKVNGKGRQEDRKEEPKQLAPKKRSGLASSDRSAVPEVKLLREDARFMTGSSGSEEDSSTDDHYGIIVAKKIQLTKTSKKFKFEKIHIFGSPTAKITRTTKPETKDTLIASECDTKITTRCITVATQGDYSFFGSFKSKKFYRKFNTTSNIQRL